MSTDDPRDLADRLWRAEVELASARDTLIQSVADLEEDVARALSWRSWVRRKPLLCLGTAFALGVVLGRRL